MESDWEQRNDNTRDGILAGQAGAPVIVHAPRGERLRSELSRVSQHIERLEIALRNLPCVTSDRSFAEAMFAQKMQHEREVASDEEKLRGYVPVLDREILRCQRNSQCIRTDLAKLHLEEAVECYSQAERAQQRQYVSAVEDRDAVVKILAKAQAVLQASRARTFPRIMPRTHYCLPGAVPGPGVPAAPTSGPFGLRGEMSGLLSLGPLGTDHRNRQPGL